MVYIKNFLILSCFTLLASARPFACVPAGDGESVGIPCPPKPIGGPYVPELHGIDVDAAAVEARQLIAPHMIPRPKVEHKPAPGSTFVNGGKAELMGGVANEGEAVELPTQHMCGPLWCNTKKQDECCDIVLEYPRR